MLSLCLTLQTKKYTLHFVNILLNIGVSFTRGNLTHRLLKPFSVFKILGIPYVVVPDGHMKQKCRFKFLPWSGFEPQTLCLTVANVTTSLQRTYQRHQLVAFTSMVQPYMQSSVLCHFS